MRSSITAAAGASAPAAPRSASRQPVASASRPATSSGSLVAAIRQSPRSKRCCASAGAPMTTRASPSLPSTRPSTLCSSSLGLLHRQRLAAPRGLNNNDASSAGELAFFIYILSLVFLQCAEKERERERGREREKVFEGLRGKKMFWSVKKEEEKLQKPRDNSSTLSHQCASPRGQPHPRRRVRFIRGGRAFSHRRR